MDKKISIITVTKNNKDGLKKTLESIKKQTNKAFELIVIDGLSEDGTLAVIKEYESIIDVAVSEKDGGIYDAMNKGVKKANCEYVLFMNAGDCFFDDTIIEKFLPYTNEKTISCFYSDTLFEGQHRSLQVGEKTPCRVVHQSFIYRKELHSKYGYYIFYKGITISDYIFFNMVHNEEWLKLPFIISLCDSSGVSQNSKHYYQKLGVDLIFGNFNRFLIGIMLFVFPVYRFLYSIKANIKYRFSLKRGV